MAMKAHFGVMLTEYASAQVAKCDFVQGGSSERGFAMPSALLMSCKCRRLLHITGRLDFTQLLISGHDVGHPVLGSFAGQYLPGSRTVCFVWRILSR